MRLGLVVNPLAGLGGAVGLRGTDGPGVAAEARRRGAAATAGARARAALEALAATGARPRLLIAPGLLGADWTGGLGLAADVLDLPPPTSTALDTRRAVAAMAGVGLVAFAGGDGTARDVLAVLPPGAAMLGIPAGTKMQSGVFAVSPRAAGRLLADLALDPARVAWDDAAEVADLDEAALRDGRIEPRLHGLARVPVAPGMQAAKGRAGPPAAALLAGAAAEVAKGMEPGVLHLLGPGTSAGAVARALGFEGTLLGVDAVRDGRLVARDATGPELEALAGEGPVRLVLGVTGRQGFLLGRGNQPITPRLAARAGREGLVVLASEAKLAALAAPVLRVDTGDAAVDDALEGWVRVRTGPGRVTLMRVAGR